MMGWKNGNKKGPAAICYEPFSGCHYSRDFMCDLNQTLSNLVNVFFKTNHLSAIFVHCLSRDGSFLKAKKLNFCNFSPHFSPLTLPHETPIFSPLQGTTSTAKFPLILPHELPSISPFREDRFAADIPNHLLSHFAHQHPFQGDGSGEILEKKQGNTFEI